MTFLYPGDWTPSAIWASGLTRSGAVAWQATLSSSYLAGAQIVSPKRDALYEYVAGVALTLGEAATVTEQGALGDGRTTTELCVYEDAASFMQSWTRAGSRDALAVVTRGNLRAGAVLTTLNYHSFVGPKEQFTALMRGVYIPIMVQFMMSAPSALTLVPTPMSGVG